MVVLYLAPATTCTAGSRTVRAGVCAARESTRGATDVRSGVAARSMLRRGSVRFMVDRLLECDGDTVDDAERSGIYSPGRRDDAIDPPRSAARESAPQARRPPSWPASQLSSSHITTPHILESTNTHAPCPSSQTSSASAHSALQQDASNSACKSVSCLKVSPRNHPSIRPEVVS